MLTKFPLNLPGTRIPGTDKKRLLDIIVKGAKKLWDKFSDSESIKEISERKKFNTDNINHVIDYNNLLSDFTKEIKKNVYELEEKIMVECIEYYEQLILLVESVEKCKNINLHSRFIKRRIENIKKETKGNLEKSIYRLISLDNYELKKLLSLPSGELKKNRIENFKGNLIRQVLCEFIDETRQSIEEFREDVSYELNEILSEISMNNDRLIKELTLLENSKDEDISALMETTKTKILLCEQIVNVIKE